MILLSGLYLFHIMWYLQDDDVLWWLTIHMAIDVVNATVTYNIHSDLPLIQS